MWKQILCILLVGIFFAGHAFAQAPATTQDNPQTTMRERESMTPEQMAQNMQQNMAKCMMLGGQAEVLMGEFAAERAQNPEVKQFAQEMVKSHNQMVAQLQRLAPGAITTENLGKRAYAIRDQLKSERGTMPVTSETSDSSRRMEPARETSEEQRSMTMEGRNPMQMISAMRQQMAENCIALTQAELMQTEKDQFDKAYMGQQICAHIGMLAEIKTLENYATGELKPIIQSVGKSTRQHLDQAKNICKQLETKTASRTERRNY